MPKKSNNEKAWDLLSREYQAHHKISTRRIHYGPNIPSEDDLQLIGDVSGKNILEMGCGGGQCSIAFARKGANVVGVDISERQIAYAKKLAEQAGLEVRFLKADVKNLDQISEASQDIVFSSYALQFVKELKQAFSEAYRVLKSGGVFVFSLDHPFYWCLSDPKKGLLLVRSYFGGPIRSRWTLPNSGGKVRVNEYPRTFSELVNLLFDVGFILAQIAEPEPIDGEASEDIWPEYPVERLKMVPATVIFKAIKPHGFVELMRKRRVEERTW